MITTTAFLFLAQATAEAPQQPDPMLPGQWVIALVVAVIGALGGWGVRAATAKREITNDPLRVAAATEYALKEDLQRIEDQVEALRSEVREALATEREVSREALGKVHRRIDTVSQTAAEMTGQLKTISENLRMLLELATKSRRS